MSLRLWVFCRAILFRWEMLITAKIDNRAKLLTSNLGIKPAKSGLAGVNSSEVLTGEIRFEQVRCLCRAEYLMGKIRPTLYVLLLIGLSFTPWATYAHHGYAAYDLTKTLTVNGTVAELEMANPHSSLTFDVKDDQGNVTRWAIEFGTLRGLLSEGWTRDTLRPGDTIKVSLHPAKNGAKVGVLVGKISYADGRSLPVKSTPNE